MGSAARDAKKAAFEVAYEAALSGKKVNQGAINKAYDQAKKQQEQKIHETEQQQILADTKARARGSERKQLQADYQERQKPAVQKKQEAQKLLDDYLQSEERKQNLAALDKQRTDDWMQAALWGGADTFIPKTYTDTKEAELRSLVDHYQAQEDREKNATIEAADREELESWSEEDRKALEIYAVDRNRDFMADPYGPKLFSENDRQSQDLIAKYGKQRVDELAESFMRQQNREASEQVTQWADREAGEHGGLHSAGSVAANLLDGLTGFAGVLQDTTNSTGRYSSLDEHGTGSLLSDYSGAVRDRVSGDISGDVYDEEGNLIQDGGKLRAAAAVLYEGAMSAADSVTRTAVLGPAGGAALAASASFGNAVREASGQGADPMTAVAYGAGVAGIEYLTEKIPMDELLKVAKGGKQGFVKGMWNVLKQSVAEATTEEISLLAGNAWEALTLMEKSGDNQRIGDLVAGGMSYADAKKQVNREFAKEALKTALVSGVSGGISGAGAVIKGNLRDAEANTQKDAPVVKQPVVEAAPEAVPGPEQLLEGIRDQTPAPAPRTALETQLDDAAAKTFGVEPAATEQETGIVAAEPAAVRESNPSVSAEPAPLPGLPAQQQDAQVGGNAVENGAQGADTDGVSMEEGRPGIKGTGAAEANFTGLQQYESLISDDNVQRARATDARHEEILKTDPQGRTVSEFAGNIGNSEVISDRDVDTLKHLIQEGALGHDTQSMADVHKAALDSIKKRGMHNVKKSIDTAVATGKINEHMVAEAEVLFACYSNRRGAADQRIAADLIVDLAQMATQSGRQLNMFKLMRRLTPEGQLMTVQQNVQRTLDKINSGRSRKKQANADIPAQLEQDFADAARDTLSDEAAVVGTVAKSIEDGMEEDTRRAAETALSRISPEGSGETDAPRGQARAGITAPGIQTNDMNERVGRRVTDTLTRQAKEQNRSVEDILYSEIMRFANDKVAAGRAQEGRPAQTPNLEAMRDYYRYRPFFQNAWDIARERAEQAMFSMQDGDPRIAVIEQFLASGDELLGVENWSPIGALDYVNPQSTVRRGTKEAATAVGIRMDNHGLQNREQVRQQLRDVLIENAANKEAAARQIARVAVETMGLDGQAAEAMAADVTRAFYNDLAQQSARRVAQMFGSDRTQRQKVEKTMMQRLGELYNMGAFSNADYRQAAFDSIFGEGSGITIDDKLMETFVNAAGERRDAAAEAIYKHAAGQIDATMKEKWDNWRYMAMLGNAKTNVRNVLGNAMMRPYYAIKRSIGAAVESVTLEQSNRTKAVLGIGKEAKALLNWAKADSRSKQAREAMKYSGTTGDLTAEKIDEYRKIYKNQGLEAIRKGIQGALENGDMLFKRQEYTVSLASFLKARGYTAHQAADGNIPPAVMAEARSYAVNEAMKATFNDRNRFSDAIVNFRARGGGFGSELLNTLGEGLMPFRRTPANIVVRAVEYSPAELVKAGIDFAGKVRSGEMSAAQCIDELAAGATGSIAWALGALLASGAVPGLQLIGEEEDENELARGVQPYSLMVGGKCYGIEWAAPANIPLFIGANLYKKLSSEPEGGDFWDVLSAFGESVVSMINPLLELSCLSSLNDAIETMAYEDNPGDKILSLVSSGATNYFLQAFPTLAGQLDQAADETKKVVYSDADNAIQRTVEKTVGRVFQKLPGDLFQVEKIGTDGKPVNTGDNWMERVFNAAVNPVTVSEIRSTALTEEIDRLNKALPQEVNTPTVPQTISYTDKEGYIHKDQRLTGEQYTTLQQVQRQTSEKILSEVISDSLYQALNDKQKASVFDYVYDYAREKGRTAAIEGYHGMDSWMEGIEGNEVRTILDKVVSSEFTAAFDELTESWREGYDEPETAKQLDQVYALYDAMSNEQQAAFLENATGRVGYFLTAKDTGLSSETFLKLYKTYYDIDQKDITEVDKAKEWAHQLQKAKENGTIKSQSTVDTLKGTMQFYQMFPAEAEKFNQLTEGGLSADKAIDIGKLLEGIEPQPGYTNARDVQKAEAIAGSGLPDQEMETALKVYLPDRQDKNLDLMLERGYSAEDYVTAYSIHANATEGAGKKKRIIAAIQEEFGVDTAEAKAIYAIFG